MADNKKKNTRPTQEEIVKGKIANALTSAAKNHIVATTDDIYDTDFQMYQDEINKLIFTGMTNEFTIHFYKKQEGSEETAWITDVKVTDENTLLTYPELKYSEFVNGGYWDTDITALRNVTGETTVYYITPFLTITDNETLLKICYNNGWSSSPDHLTINEAESITDEMVAEASKKLSLIEDEQGNLIEVFDSIIYEEEGEEPVVMTSYNLYDGLCYDKNGNEYNITDCCCYSKDGKRYSLDEVKYGNCFYELESWTELPYFTGITKLSDGETYRVFLDYSHIRDINMENIASLPAYTLFRCTNLEHIFIPSGLTDIETYAIASCDGLQSLVVDENNPKYTSRNSQGVECNCIVEKPDNRGRRSAVNNQLTLIQGCNVSILPDNIKHIASGAFDECTRLTSITLPDGLLTIGTTGEDPGYTFNGCTALSGTITIPDSVEEIGKCSFMNCSSLQGVNINTPYVSTQLFKNCSSLSYVTLGNSVTEIANQSFMNDSSLTAITIPNRITTIGEGAFAGASLINVTIPNSVNTIETGVFSDCLSLREATFGSGVITIPKRCFSGCTSLETVDLSNNPNKIDLANPSAFRGCDNLSLIIVPDNLITEYRESLGWYDYREIIFGTSIYTITFDSVGGETTPSTQNVRCGAYIEDPGSVHKDLYEFEYWEDEDGNEWNFEEDYVVGDMTLYAHYREVKAIMVKSISNDVTNISMGYNGSNPANVEYSYDGLNWYNIWDNNNLTISLSEGYSDYVYFRGYNPDGFSRNGSNYTWFNINNSQCDLLGNIMYLKNYNEELDYVNNSEFSRLFQNCYAIVNANDFVLPATTLALFCYYYMFHGCSSLTTAPELPATTLANGCYSSMFSNCTSLTTAPELPATTLANSCYNEMFEGCTNLTSASELPATTLANYCYSGMFEGCSGLTTAPELPASTLADYCYNSMFQNCSSLTTAPELPATILVEGCYYYMFQGCTSLTTSPELPATTLAQSCYYFMFNGCSNLTTAPELPATTLANYCYEGMFSNCTSLTTAPELPATTLANSCYRYMFYGCTSLTTAPELPATTLTLYCYSNMFGSCSSLIYIKCLAVNGINQNSSTASWVNGVQTNSGTFVKHPFASWDTCSANGIPCNWTVEDAEIQIDNYITFTALEDNAPISLNRISSNQKLLYSTDDGETWNNFTTGITITLTNSGDTCYVAGMLSGNNTTSNYTRFNLPNRVSVSGNINSLWNYMDLEQNLYQYCGYDLFSNSTGLVDASGLTLGTSATTLANNCYYYMFYGCSSLTTAPELPATTLANYCYSGMFSNCTSLTTTPELPATTLTDYCYYLMFYGCSGLNYIKCLAVNGINQNSSTASWVNGVQTNSGTFVKHPNATSWPTGNNGIPTNWTVEDANIE